MTAQDYLHNVGDQCATCRHHKLPEDYTLLVEYILSLEFHKLSNTREQGPAVQTFSQSDCARDMLQETEGILGSKLWPLAEQLLQMHQADKELFNHTDRIVKDLLNTAVGEPMRQPCAFIP